MGQEQEAAAEALGMADGVCPAWAGEDRLWQGRESVQLPCYHGRCCSFHTVVVIFIILVPLI